MRIKDDRNDSSTKKALSAFPKDGISQQIKDTMQDVVHLSHLGPYPISCLLQVLHWSIQILVIIRSGHWLCFVLVDIEPTMFNLQSLGSNYESNDCEMSTE